MVPVYPPALAWICVVPVTGSVVGNSEAPPPAANTRVESKRALQTVGKALPTAVEGDGILTIGTAYY